MLLFSIFFFAAFSAIDAQAQNANSGFEGTWILDSVQVKEIMPDSIINRTVLPGGYSKFNNSWMLQFTLNANGKASYTEINNRTVRDIPYTITDTNGSSATLTINGIPDYKILNAQLLSDNVILLTISFSTGYKLKDIEVSWKMYYSKSN